MNKMNNVLLGVVLVLVASYGLADGHGDVEGLKDSPSKTLARAWVTAGYSGTDKFLAMVKENMADDGVVVIPRFVGFGFLMDPNNQDQMVVARVIPGTPASGVLRQGDVFVSVPEGGTGISALESAADIESQVVQQVPCFECQLGGGSAPSIEDCRRLLDQPILGLTGW